MVSKIKGWKQQWGTLRTLPASKNLLHAPAHQAAPGMHGPHRRTRIQSRQRVVKIFTQNVSMWSNIV